MELPPIPVDDSSLDIWLTALKPSEGSVRTSINDVLDVFSMLGGSTPGAEYDFVSNNWVSRGPRYHVNDLLLALIEEIKRLREIVRVT